MSLNTYVKSTQTSCTAYWSGVEVLAANQSVGVKLDQGPFAHNQNGGSVDTVTFSTTHGASYIVLFVSGFDSSGGAQLTCTVGSTTLTFSLLVSGDHTGQNGAAGTARLSAIYGAYASGSLTNEVVTVTFNQNAQSGIDVCSFSGVVSSSPVGVTVVPTWGSSLTTLQVAFNTVTQGSVCLVGVASSSGAVTAGEGTNLYAHPYNNLWSMGLLNPAGIAVTAAATTGSGGCIAGGSATEGVAYALGTVGVNYSIYVPQSSGGTTYLSRAIPGGDVPNGVLGAAWSRFVIPTASTIAVAMKLQGSNWQATLIPQLNYISLSNWLLATYVDIAIGSAAPNTYYLNDFNLQNNQATFPEFTLDNLKDWCWFAVQIIPSITNGLQINIYMQCTPSGVIRSSLTAYSLASIRADAITAGMPSAQANVWVPDVNCVNCFIGPYGAGGTQVDMCRCRLYNATAQPSSAQLVSMANNLAPDATAYADWPFYWAGQASGNGINTGVQVNDQSGNGRSLTLNGASQLFLGPPLPTSYNNLLVVAAPGG